MVRINGVDVDAADTNLQEYLLKEGYRPERIAVERNGQIVPPHHVRQRIAQRRRFS